MIAIFWLFRYLDYRSSHICKRRESAHPPANHQPPMSHDDIDPITVEVVCDGLRAIVKVMRATIIHA